MRPQGSRHLVLVAARELGPGGGRVEDLEAVVVIALAELACDFLLRRVYAPLSGIW